MPDTYRAVTGILAGARSATALGISTARQAGDMVGAADLRTSLNDLRAAMSLHTGAPPGDVHRDGWRLTTDEARAYLADSERRYRGETQTVNTTDTTGTSNPVDRRAVARAFDTAVINGVGMSLGKWAGRGDWAKFSQESRDDAGQRALSELDSLIQDLTTFRQRLADAVGDGRQGDNDA